VANKQLVLAVFPHEQAADSAAEALKSWDKFDDDVKLHAVGVLVLDEEGKIKTHKLGRRAWGKGAGIGVVLAVFLPATLLAGGLAGGVLGSLVHKGLGIDSAERDDIAKALQDGKAAVGALVTEEEASVVSHMLEELGGDTHVLTPSEAAVAEVDAAAPQLAEAEAAEADRPTAS
jgi:uncharacterized membrane protein